jgi:hypothetical protein
MGARVWFHYAGHDKRGGTDVSKALLIPLALAVSMLAACGVRQDNPNSDKSAIIQSGCTVDFKKVCQALIDQPTFSLNGVEYDARRLQENSARHTNVELPFTMLNGNLIATAECQFDTQNRTVSYARLLPGPPITDEDMQFLRSRGWCAEQNPDYGKLMSTGKPPFSTGAN